MIKILVVIVLCFSVLFSQEKNSNSTSAGSSTVSKDKKKEKRKDLPSYRIKNKYPLDVYHYYRMTETSKILKTNEDNSVSESNREVTYFFTIRATELPEEDFYKVKVNIDSMRYEYKQGDKILKHNSQSDETPPINNFDFLSYFLSNNKEFYLTYSPYGDVAKIEGEILENYRNMIKGNPDENVKNLFYKKSGDRDLSFIVDLGKKILPYRYVTTDTSWNHTFDFDIEGIYYKSKANTRILQTRPSKYVLECVTDTMRNEASSIYLFDLKQTADIKNSYAVGKYVLDVTTDGALEYAKAEFVSSTDFLINKKKQNIKVSKVVVWDLLKRTKF